MAKLAVKLALDKPGIEKTDPEGAEKAAVKLDGGCELGFEDDSEAEFEEMLMRKLGLLLPEEETGEGNVKVETVAGVKGASVDSEGAKPDTELTDAMLCEANEAEEPKGVLASD